MEIARTLQQALGGKADAAARTQITGEPRIGRSTEAREYYGVTNAKNHGEAYGGGKNGIDWFYDAANIIAKAAASAPFHFEDDSGNKYALRRTAETPAEWKDAPDDLRILFEQPNPWMGWQEHIMLAAIDKLAVGNYFWLKHNPDKDGNKPFALYRMAPPYVTVESGRGQLIKQYTYGEGRDTINKPPTHVVHGRLPNPHSPNSLIGLGAIQAAPQVADIELGMQSAQRAFFARGTVLAGAIESDKNIAEPNRKRMTREFQRLHRGSSNWYSVAFLERGLRYRPIQANAQEAGYEALSKLTRDRIFALLGVPRILAGIDDGLMKLEEARRFFAEETMAPFLGSVPGAPPGGLSHELSTAITQAWGLRLVYDYGYQLPETDRLENALSFSELPGVMVREVRERAGIGALGDDVVDAQGNKIDDYVLNMPGPSTESDEGVPDKRDRQGGRPPDPESTASFPRDDNAGDRASDKVNGRPASSKDRARRATAGVVVPRKRAGKALTAAAIADGSWQELVPAGVSDGEEA